MVQGKEQKPLETTEGRSLLEVVHGGIALHLRATANLIAGNELSPNEKDTLRDAGSNAINNPYVWGWLNIGFYTEYPPAAISPSSELHAILFRETRLEYDRLQNRQMRIYLAGEEGANVNDPETPISPEESLKYLARAQARGVIEGFSDTTNALKIDSNLIPLFIALLKQGVQIKAGRIDEYLEILFTERFKTDLQRAALHKLGTYIALIEQMGYEGQETGKLIPANYIPLPDPETAPEWEIDKAYYGGRIPALGEFYQMAQEVLRTHSSDDPLIRHLLTLPSSLA